MTRKLITLCTILLAAPLSAEVRPTDKVIVVGGNEFVAWEANDTLKAQQVGADLVWETASGLPLTGPFLATVHVPNGTVITGLESEYCGATADDRVSAFAQHISCNGDVCNSTGLNVLPPLEAGCQRPLDDVDALGPINNRHDRVIVGINFYGQPGFRALRVYYREQVTPPPAVASFVDVPVTHPFFRFIEAIRSAGLTAGCTPTRYCPDSPVTRGQMAVFLATALGVYTFDQP